MELTPEQQLARMVCESIQRTMPSTLIRWTFKQPRIRTFLHKHHLAEAQEPAPTHTHLTLDAKDPRLTRARSRVIFATIPKESTP